MILAFIWCAKLGLCAICFRRENGRFYLFCFSFVVQWLLCPFLQDALISDPGNSSGTAASVGSIDPMKCSTSDSSDLNDLNGSSSDLLYNDDEDGDEDSDDAGHDDDDYLSDYDDFSYSDEYSHLQSQFDNVDLPPGVEAPVPWLNDPSTSQNVPAAKTLIISDLPESKREEVGSCSLTVNAESSSNIKVGDPEDVVMKNYLQFKQFDVVNDFSDHHYFRTGSEEKQVKLIAYNFWFMSPSL